MKKRTPKPLAMRIALAVPLGILMLFGLLCSVISRITNWLEIVSYDQFDSIFYYATGDKFTKDEPE